MLSSLLGQLASLGSRPELSSAVEDRQLRRQHQALFAEWLALSLEQQFATLEEYLGGCGRDSRTLIQQWTQTHWYDLLVPAGAPASERELFIADFEIILAIAYGDLQPETESPDLIRQPRQSVAAPIALKAGAAGGSHG